MFERYQYTPTIESLTIRTKLREACRDQLNAAMEFCKNLDAMIRKGDEVYAQARSWWGGGLTMTYRYFGGVIEGRENTIFTEPQSSEYCEQYYLLYPRVPVIHPDARYDIKKILKMRVNAETQVCEQWYNSQPVVMRTPEQALEEELHSLRFYWQAQNLTHPIINVYQAITEIVSEQKLRNISYTTNQVYSFVAAGEEIINVMVKQQRQPNYINFNISSALASIPKHYIHLATEPVRLIQAQALHEINNTAITPLMALEMTSRTDVRYGKQLHSTLAKDEDLAMDRGAYLTFDQMPEEQLAAFNVLMDNYNFNATHAINFVDYAVDLNYKMGLRGLKTPQNIVQAVDQRTLYVKSIMLLTYCSPYNATNIVTAIIGGIFREQLEIAMQPCANMARHLEHDGFHLHNMLSRDYHARIHELEDQYHVEANSELLIITSIFSFIIFMTLLAGIHRVARPLISKCFSNSSGKRAGFKTPESTGSNAVFEAMEITTSKHCFFDRQGKKKSTRTDKKIMYTAISKPFPGWL